MGRKKRNSKVLEQAHQRLNGMKSVDPNLDLGGGLTVGAFETAVNSLRVRLDSYNQKLSDVDEELLKLEGEEETLNDTCGRVLAGTGARFGKNSAEYEAVGGVRTDDRKHRPRKVGAQTPSKN